jgi:hypothetical protein
VPDITELPVCRCGKDMHTANVSLSSERRDTHVRVYNCPACHHEMRFTFWGADTVTCPAAPSGSLE